MSFTINTQILKIYFKYTSESASDEASVKKAKYFTKCVFKTIFCLSKTLLNGFQIDIIYIYIYMYIMYIYIIYIHIYSYIYVQKQIL